jgi:hypothetical protein
MLLFFHFFYEITPNSHSVRQTPGVTILDVDPGVSTNRTVLTFVGGPDAVVNGAFNLAKKALVCFLFFLLLTRFSFLIFGFIILTVFLFLFFFFLGID